MKGKINVAPPMHSYNITVFDTVLQYPFTRRFVAKNKEEAKTTACNFFAEKLFILPHMVKLMAVREIG